MEVKEVIKFLDRDTVEYLTRKATLVVTHKGSVCVKNKQELLEGIYVAFEGVLERELLKKKGTTKEDFSSLFAKLPQKTIKRKVENAVERLLREGYLVPTERGYKIVKKK